MLQMTDKQIEEWIALLDDMDNLRRSYARMQLIAIGAPIIDRMIEIVEAQQGRRCWEALDVLNEIEDPRASRAIADALLLPHPLIGHTAARLLQLRGDSEAAEQLLDILFRCEPAVQMRVVSALGALRYAPAIPALIQLLQDTESDTIRYLTIETLITLNAKEALPVILNYADNDNHHVRERVELAIKHFQQEK